MPTSDSFMISGEDALFQYIVYTHGCDSDLWCVTRWPPACHIVTVWPLYLDCIPKLLVWILYQPQFVENTIGNEHLNINIYLIGNRIYPFCIPLKKACKLFIWESILSCCSVYSNEFLCVYVCSVPRAHLWWSPI